VIVEVASCAEAICAPDSGEVVVVFLFGGEEVLLSESVLRVCARLIGQGEGVSICCCHEV
jgi:hypothetical protein